jgi:hypothetical protein
VRRRPRRSAALLLVALALAATLAVLTAANEPAGGPGPQHRVTTTSLGGGPWVG